MLRSEEPTPADGRPASARRPELRRYAADGTLYMVLGTLVAGLGNYGYQLLGGRALGPEDFAPVGTLLTFHFLAFIVVLLPVEQLEIRSLSLHAGVDRSTRRAALSTILITAIGASVIALVGVDRFFDGEQIFAALVLAIILAHGLFVIGRGHLAGHRQFSSYGLASGGAALVKLAVAVVLVAVAPNPFTIGLAIAFGPLIILAWPSSMRRPPEPAEEGDSAPGRFLSTFILAAAASQVLLLAGPLVAGLMDATAAEVSIVFVTFTLARTPLVFGYNLIARVLPPFTNLAKVGYDHELNWWVRRLALGGLALAIPIGLLGAWLGPFIVGVLFGEGFQPTAAFAGLVSAGVIIGGASLFIGQVLVARAETARLALAWLVGLAAASGALVIADTDVVLRIGIAFIAGEVAALIATSTLANRRGAVAATT